MTMAIHGGKEEGSLGPVSTCCPEYVQYRSKARA